MPTAPLSLYIDVEPDRSVELEVAARASLQFAAAVREAAFLYDPSFQFRLELLRADEGSNWIKTRLRWIRGVHFPRATMTGVLVASSFMVEHVASKVFDEAWDATFHSGEHEAVTPLERDQIIAQAVRAAVAASTKERVRSIYRELEQDQSVVGVGVAPSHTSRPHLIVPRSEFSSRSAPPPPEPVLDEKRHKVLRADYVIIKPVLKEGSTRWRLKGPSGEFSATIADLGFLEAVLNGSTNVPLASGIHMTADLEIIEERTAEGLWRPVDHRVIRVFSIRRQPQQRTLIGPPE